MILRSTNIGAALRSRQRGFIIDPFRFGGEVDPHASSVVLLLHGHGANNSQTITDSSSYARSVTANGNCKNSTTQSKYGGSSLYYDGTGDGTTCANSTDFYFGSGDFTVEHWVYPDSTADYDLLSAYHNGTAANSNYSFVMYKAATQWQMGIYTGTTYKGNGAFGTATANTWHHVAMSRVGNSLYSSVDGTVQTPVDVTGVTVNNPASSVLRTGWDNNTISFGGYMHTRITKGVGRYTANFTPPGTFP